MNQKPVPIFNKPLSVPLTEKRRELMLRVMDGVTDLSGVCYILHHYKFCDNILTWLICHNVTGKNLVDTVVNQFRGSVPSLVDFVVSAINSGGTTNARETHP